MAQRMTVKQAARGLGASPDAIRKRVSRGTLDAEKLPDGTVLVWVDATEDNGQDGGAPNGVHPTTAHVETLERYIARLEAELEDRKEEARRKDHIIMSLTQRVPELLPSEKPARKPEEWAADEEAARADVGLSTRPDAQQQSWWRRLFGG